MPVAQLSGPTDWTGFRAQARAALAQGWAPEHMHWRVAGSDADDLWAEGDDATLAASAEGTAPLVQTTAPDAPMLPRRVVALMADAALHDDPQRHALLYRWLWRMAHQPSLAHDPLDPDAQQVRLMARAVHRERHRLHAFLRLRPVTAADGRVLHVGWFEPAHHIVESAAPHFLHRLGRAPWAIFTPRACVHSDGERLHVAPGVDRAQAHAALPSLSADAGDALWLTYYASTFNPARANPAALVRQMPRRYWADLPEAALIAPLLQDAAWRTGRMIHRDPEPLPPGPATPAPAHEHPRHRDNPPPREGEPCPVT